MATTKQAQSSFGQHQGATLHDLYREIRADRSLPHGDSERVITDLARTLGNPSSSTPLSSLATGAVGGLLGFLISKYFGMGWVGRAITTAAGFGIGRTLDKQLATSPPGWRRL